MLKAFLAAAVVVVVAASAANAVDIGGKYEVRGTNLDGSKYRGTAKIVVTSDSTCRIYWNTGSEASGICMRNGIALSAAYAMNRSIGLVIYEIRSDGTLDGLWTVADEDGVGTELLIPE